MLCVRSKVFSCFLTDSVGRTHRRAGAAADPADCSSCAKRKRGADLLRKRPLQRDRRALDSGLRAQPAERDDCAGQGWSQPNCGSGRQLAVEGAYALDPGGEAHRKAAHEDAEPACGEELRRANVGAKATVEADADWPRKDNTKQGLERPGGGCRSGSPP
jgi:hypothetical protein